MIKPQLSPFKCLSLGVILLLLGSFTPPSSSLENAKSSSLQKQQTFNSKTKNRNFQAVKPGQYCFKYNTKVFSSEAQLNVNRNNRVNGGIVGVIQDDKQGYYSSYNTYFEGILNNNQLKVNTITQIEYDTQERQETWNLTPNSLKTGRETYTKVACSSLSDNAFNRISRIRFAPGKKSAVIENSLVRGSRDIYLINAKAGQTMKISITSLEKNAVFDLIAPNKDLIQGEITSKNLKLPTTGNYEIIVGGTRGNASYKLQVEIN
jgi:hypothetical protein